LVGTIIQIIGVIIQVTAWNVPQIIVGRIVTGLGVGALTSTIPTYQSETCPPKNRGKVVAIDCTVTLIGVVMAYWCVMVYSLAYDLWLINNTGSITGVRTLLVPPNGVSRFPSSWSSL
jgi:MFS family permease